MEIDSKKLTVEAHGQELIVQVPHPILGTIMVEIANASKVPSDPTCNIAHVAIWIPTYTGTQPHGFTAQVVFSNGKEIAPKIKLANGEEILLGYLLNEKIRKAEKIVVSYLERVVCELNEGDVATMATAIVRALSLEGLVKVEE